MAHKAFTRAWPDFRSETQLLIVQRNELFARSLARYLSAHYSRVLVASTAAAAEELLRESSTRLHVVCGQVLGAGEPDGVSCLVRWRAEFPDVVVRAVIATGADTLPTMPTAVDGLFRTPNDPRELLELLQIPALIPTQQPHFATFNHDSVPNEDIMKTSKTQTKAHDIKTLKDKSAIVARPSATALSTAQGFTVA
jgi:DNA-binding response OmpR family regulator